MSSNSTPQPLDCKGSTGEHFWQISHTPIGFFDVTMKVRTDLGPLQESIMRTRLYAASLLVAVASVASADILITIGNNPVSGEESITFPVGYADNASLVQGRTITTAFDLDFFGAGETLTTPDATPDRVVAADGAFQALTMRPTVVGATVNSFTLNLTGTDSGTVTFDIFELDGPGWMGVQFAIGNGTNYFTIESINGGRIRSVSLTSDIGISSARGMKASAMLVPEPGTMLVLALGFAATSRLRRMVR